MAEEGRLSEDQATGFIRVLNDCPLLRDLVGDELGVLLSLLFPNPEKRPTVDEFTSMRNRYMRHLS
jgi:hypothetical protein